jgi:Ca-activated chloride channel family protein
MLAIDVSGSVDAGEYRLQTDGLANALSDPSVAEEILRAQAALAVMEWSGAGQQRVVIPWTRIENPFILAAFRDRASSLSRSWDGSDTAVGDAIAAATAEFPAVADCRRHVLDISGDGDQNAGGPLAAARGAAVSAGITINAIAIEGIGVSITEFYRRRVISTKGFVLTARGHTDYPRAIREKILREVTIPGM